jgi:hypothetical protein
MPVKKTTKTAAKKPVKGVTATVGSDEDLKTESRAKSPAANVLDRSGAIVRCYSMTLHGEDYLELAHTYATKIGGSVVELK